MPDQILRVGAEFDVGPLVAGAQQAGTAMDQLKARFIASGMSAAEASSALENLGFKEAALVAPANEASAAHLNMGSAMGAARVEAGLLDGSTGMVVGGFARMAAASQTLAPLIEAAFVPFAIVAFADIAFQAGEKLYSLYQNVVLNKAEMDALSKIEETLTADTAKLAAETETAYIAYLKLVDPVEAAREKLRSLADERFTFKIDDKELKALPDVVTELGLKYRQTIQAFSNFPASDTAEKIEEIGNTIAAVQVRLAAPTLRGPLDRQELEGELKLLQSIQTAIQQFQDRVANQQRVGVADIGKVEEDQAKKAEEAAKRAAEEEKKRFDAYWKQLREQVKGEEAVAAARRGGSFPVEPVTQPPDTSAMEAANKKMADDAVTAAQKLKDASATAADQLDIAFEKSFERMAETARKAWEKATEAAKKAAEEQKREVDRMTETMTRAFENSFDGVIRGTETVKFAFIKLGGDMILAVVHSLEQQVAHFAAAEVMKLALHVSGQTAQTAATTTGSAQREVVEEAAFFKWIGREVIKLATWIYHEFAKTTATTTGNITREAVEVAAHAATVTMDAGDAAAGAYAATAVIPFVGPALAPAAAATAFAATMAFGAAEQGAVLAHDTIVAAHKNEMILPAPISSAVQGAVPAIQAFNAASKEGFGGIGAPGAAGAAGQAGAAGVGASRSGGSTTNVNIHAMDAQSMADAFQRSRSTVLGMVRGAIRNGVRV